MKVGDKIIFRRGSVPWVQGYRSGVVISLTTPLRQAFEEAAGRTGADVGEILERMKENEHEDFHYPVLGSDPPREGLPDTFPCPPSEFRVVGAPPYVPN